MKISTTAKLTTGTGSDMTITKALLESVISGNIIESDDHWARKYASAAGHALDKANMQTTDSPDYHMWMGVHHHHLGKGKRVVDAHNNEAQQHTKKVSKATPEGSRFHQGLTRHWELP